ncbi:uncharacterized protein LY79DRAFT_52370 [Colletotrichum navitas]|uniref:Uncharacterized protein n=1 Tax=Colletotrichum navitas TaxID=681940 RepID=A0AAD8V741_9PEZI|nr:uncharacterized protein LY79DRAFT_52370 [Colletotrichum navitas]KAK1596747.1 hypothetical protein LY79DRAFT_52370 [Colletotrichum navitas]
MTWAIPAPGVFPKSSHPCPGYQRYPGRKRRRKRRGGGGKNIPPNPKMIPFPPHQTCNNPLCCTKQKKDGQLGVPPANCLHYFLLPPFVSHRLIIYFDSSGRVLVLLLLERNAPNVKAVVTLRSSVFLVCNNYLPTLFTIACGRRTRIQSHTQNKTKIYIFLTIESQNMNGDAATAPLKKGWSGGGGGDTKRGGALLKTAKQGEATRSMINGENEGRVGRDLVVCTV